MQSSRIVAKNAGALLVIQIANQILPLFLIPYLTRTLGLHAYGVMAFGIAIMNLACVVTDYGFNLSATALIAAHRDKKRVNHLIGAIFACKLTLLLAVLLALISYAMMTRKYEDNTIFLLLMFLPIAGQTLQPIWFFQGVEKMAYITFYTLASRLLYLLLIVVLVGGPADLPWVALCSGVSQFLAAALGLVLLLKQGYRPEWPGRNSVIDTFRYSTAFFWSRAAVSTYTAGAGVFLGLVSTPAQVAFFSAAEQLYRGAQSLFAPLAQALYPNMVRTKNFPLLFKTVSYSTLFCILMVAVGAFIGNKVLSVLFGAEFAASSVVLLVFLLTLAVNTPSVLIGYPLLGALGHANVANRTVLVAGGLQIALLLTCYIFQWIGALHIAMTVLAAETLVLTLRSYAGRKHYRAWMSCRVHPQ